MARESGADLTAMAPERWSDLDCWLNGSVTDGCCGTRGRRTSWVLRRVTRQVLPDTTSLRSLVQLDGSPFAEEVWDAVLGRRREADAELTVLSAPLG
jgi:hypothetical protein